MENTFLTKVLVIQNCLEMHIILLYKLKPLRYFIGNETAFRNCLYACIKAKRNPPLRPNH